MFIIAVLFRTYLEGAQGRLGGGPKLPPQHIVLTAEAARILQRTLHGGRGYRSMHESNRCSAGF